MTTEQLHAEWWEWVKDKIHTIPKSDLVWLAWREAWSRANKAIAEVDKPKPTFFRCVNKRCKRYRQSDNGCYAFLNVAYCSKSVLEECKYVS